MYEIVGGFTGLWCPLKMPKQLDPVWDEWSSCGTINVKEYAACKFCGYKLQKNVCRFKQHIVIKCDKAPEHLKKKYQITVSNQSLITSKQKLTLLEDNHRAVAVHKSVQESPPVELKPQPCCSTAGETVTGGTGAHVHHSTDHDEYDEPGTGKRARLQLTTPALNTQPTPIAGFMDKITGRDQAKLDLLWAQTVFTNSWSFNCMNSPSLIEFSKKLRPSYKPPSAYQLSHGLLDKVKFVSQWNRAILKQ
jgi:hypothetical protein